MSLPIMRLFCDICGKRFGKDDFSASACQNCGSLYQKVANESAVDNAAVRAKRKDGTQ